jgi:hypothetical protein
MPVRCSPALRLSLRHLAFRWDVAIEKGTQHRTLSDGG